MATIITITKSANARETAGVGSVINAHPGKPHEGITKRPAENHRLDELTAADIVPPENRQTDTDMLNASFLGMHKDAKG